MTVPFKNIPAGDQIRVPLFYAEVDNSQANSATQTQHALVIGQITSAGAATPNIPVISQGAADAKSAGGPGSMLALMTAAYRNSDSFGEVWYLPLADDPSAVAAAGSINFTAAATAAGVLFLYLAGQLVTQNVTSSLTAAQLATALTATVNANTDLPVTAAVDGTTTSKVNFTAKNKGLAGNDIDIRVNYRGAANGEVTPTGLAFTITAMTGGSVNPSLTTALANLADAPFDFIVMPYTDATSLDALKSFLNDTNGRWSWSKQIYGHFFAAYRGTVGALTTFGVTRNDQHGTVMGFNDSPTPAWLLAADYSGAVAAALRADPGLPLQTVALSSFLPPPVASRFALTDRNTLLFDGISTFTVADDGTVAVENLITTYQKNPFGQPDNSYLQVETLFLLMYVLRRLKGVVTSKYGRKKLAANGTRFAPGANIVTPNTIRADQIAEYKAMEFEGYVQNSDAFAAGLIVEIDSQNPSRVNELWDGTLIGGLRIFALLAQFRLQ
ncbi:phage tail sheath subtilisin-like domain-containing protein [Paraburkholderia largidicola]|uniref:Tail protein n=1 Tax=Paraburkholderia largidicola TaxID=3014751 RepID=A0A7I8BJ75_9BURK|nr:phage tail sheath subtilisin-like domain-containing protein [Paraburkholderia sp. PGU16]BCF88672.1 tail protein [Paraburkholderia sp. PGU16]